MPRRSLLSRLGVPAAFLLLASGAYAQNVPWVTAWGTSQQSQGATRISNATVRMIARVSLSGEAVRIRLDNTFGKTPVTFSKASIAPRVRGAAVAVGTTKPLTFAGQATVTVAPGGSVTSDAVAMHVEAQQDLAVSLFIAGDAQPSQHNNAQVTSFMTANGAGDLTGMADATLFTERTTAMFWLKAIDVQSAGATAIVAFGDSITDGTCSTLDAHDRWEDVVSQRLTLAGAKLAMVNEGIGGNTITSTPQYMPAVNSEPGLTRFDRDVAAHAGVSHVVLFIGTNDIGRGASAQVVIDGLRQLMDRLRSSTPKKKVIAATIIPRHTTASGVGNIAWTDEKTRIRNEVNSWIRGKAGFDGVLDFDKVMARKGSPDWLEAAYECGDGVHPAPIGYWLMGKSVALSAFGVR